ncbi:poly [ADP-ribose] polymerase tankyrase-like isoform X1 [Branchiostoma lanceolatum]|uniref:poly [ADP-ribose] polymerase tankyrase-like isoform X1 n=2 Tax=Branchiostoma lanceolatum TaxID=7740 RepID=UPI0034529B13
MRRRTPVANMDLSKKGHHSTVGLEAKSSTHKRGVTDSSNDGPAKRLRTNPPKVEPFYTLGVKEEEAAQPSTSGASTGAINKILYFYKGEYIAVRNDEGSFYLCEASQNIYNTSKTFKVRWLEVEDAPNIYRKSYYDNIELESIITHVKLQRMEKDKYVLPQAEILKTKKILRRAITGIAEDDEDVVLDVKEEEEDETVTPKKTRVKAKLKAKKTKAPIRTRAKKVAPPAVKRGKAAVKKAIAKVTKRGKSAAKKGKPSKAPAKQTATMIKEELLKKLGKGGPLLGPDKKLTPRPDMKVPERDPSFEERSSPSHLLPQKQSIRAVLLNDMKLLRSLIADTKNIPTVYDALRSVDMSVDAVMYAIRNRNKDAIKLFGDHMKKISEPRCSRPYSLLKHQGTGRYNWYSLGHAVRNISMSRGSKEGNNAFTKDISDGLDDYTETYAKEVLQTGAPKDLLDLCIAVIPDFKDQLFDNIYLAVRAGHRKLAGKLVEMAEKGGGYGFNQLHKEVLLFDKQELTTFRAVSVKKKPYGNQVMTPLHCAAINPNPKYLQKLLAMCPEYGLTDKTGRKPIHYAAACEGSGPLEFLLSRGMSAEDGDNQANTALVIAAENGRANNVDLILKKLKQQAKDAGEDADAKAAYISLVQRANRQSFAAIHLAAKGGHGNVVKILHKHGANLDQALSAGKNKVTPLMLASAQGHLGTVKVLVEIGATVEKRDKLKRTALTHAAMNGHYPVMAFLLRMGADPNSVDTSGNSVAHYAAGYGWWHCLKLLLKVGADPNKPNDWKVTPVGIAVLKGNADCVDLLFDLKGPDGQPLADVNFKDEKGLTLVAMLAASPLSTGLPQQICYLIKRNADITIPDLEGWTPLHYLAQNPIKSGSYNRAEVDKGKADMSLEIANILLDKGADPSVTTASGKTPIMLAIEQFNVGLVRLMVKRGGTISASSVTEDKDTTLHLLAKNCMLEDLTEILKVLVEQGDEVKAALVSQATQVNNHGCTPLLSCTRAYAEFEPRGMKDEALRKAYENGRTMMKMLIDLCESDINTQVQSEKHKKENECTTAVHFMVKAKDPLAKIDGDWSEAPGLQTLLKYKPELDVVDKKGRSPLVIAILQKKTKCIELLVDSGADINMRAHDLKEDGMAYPILLATRQKLQGVVAMLAKKGANVNSIDERDKRTALHVAVSGSTITELEFALLDTLLDAGADVDAVDEKQRTPLHIAVNANSGSTDSTAEVEEKLLEKGAKPDVRDIRGRIPLHYAFVKIKDHQNKTATDPIEVTTTLTVAMNGKGIDTADEFGQTPLHRAALRGATICCLHLVEKGADIDKKDLEGNSPLSLAIKGGHISCTIMLIQKGADIISHVVTVPPPPPPPEKNPTWLWKPLIKQPPKIQKDSLFCAVVERGWQGVTYIMLDRLLACKLPFFVAIEGALHAMKYRLVLTLMKKVREDVKLQTNNAKQQNLLHVLSLNAPGDDTTDLPAKVGEVLIQRGVALRAQDEHGCTPLTYAAVSQNVSLCKLFLEKKPEIAKALLVMPDKKGRTPLAALLWENVILDRTLEILKLFLDCGASLNILSDFPRVDYLSIQHQTVEGTVEEYYNGNMATVKTTPLMRVINVHAIKAERLMLRNEADVNLKDAEGKTAIMHAVRENDINLVRLLLDPNYVEEPVKLPGLKKTQSNASARGGTRRRPLAFGLQQQNEDEDEEEDMDEDEEEEEEEEEDMEDNMEDGMDNEEEMDMDEEEEEEEDNVDDEDYVPSGTENSEESQESQEQEAVRNNGRAMHKAAGGLAPAKELVMNKADTVLVTKLDNYIKPDLGAMDNKGWTVVHHLVQPMEYGSYENVEILELLHKEGAPLDVKDKAGKTPLDYALGLGYMKLAEAINRLLGVTGTLTPAPKSTDWDDGMAWDEPPSDFRQDAEEVLTWVEQQERERRQKEGQELVALVDNHSDVEAGTGAVLLDPELNLPYDMLGTKVDVQYGKYGMNNFYKMQVIHQKGKDMYILMNRWGRVGDSGQFQRTPFLKAEDAVKEFCKIFKAKTGNNWKDVKNFQKQHKKYHLVPLAEQAHCRKEAANISINLKDQALPSKLQDKVKGFMEELTNLRTISDSMRSTGVDQAMMPFGRLRKEAMKEGMKILGEIKKVVEKADEQQKETFPDAEQYQEDMEKVAELSNKYYQLIPPGNYSHEKIGAMVDQRAIKREYDKLSSLMDLEVASKVLVGAHHKREEVNALDYVYRAIGCQIQLVDQESNEAQYILRYIHNTDKNANVKAIFRLARPGETERLSSCGVGNSQLLFHGTSPTNLISILHKGLLVAPPEAPASGYMFGKGIYFADQFSKSESYCYDFGSERRTKFMLLCEVALGNHQDLYDATYMEKPPEGFHSTKGVGRKEPHPAGNVTVQQGVTIPLGETVDTPPPSEERRYWYLPNNEYIVYDPAQVRLRYLIQFKE